MLTQLIWAAYNQQYTTYMSVTGLERMTTGSAVSALSYRATQVDIIYMCSILTKGSTCRKNKNLRFLLILIEQVMTNLLKKN